MNKLFRLAVAFAALSVLSAAAHAAPYRFVSFNVWGDYFGNPPEERDLQEKDVLRGLSPDFIALQEMTAGFWASRLALGLEEDYEAVGRKMGPGGADAFTPVFFRRDRYELLEKGAVWFHPELDKSKGAVWAAVKDVRTGKRIVVFSSHFWWRADGEGDDYLRLDNARRLHAEVSAAAERHSAAVFGGGDLNTGLASSALVEMAQLGWRDAQATAPGRDTRPSWHGNPVRGPDGKYHGTSLDKAAKTMSLDHVFYRPERAEAYEFRLAVGGGVEDLSDHYPLVADFLVHERRDWRDPPRALGLAPKAPGPGSAKIVGHWSDTAAFVRGTSEEALWHIEAGELAGSQAKVAEVALDAPDGRTPIAAICGVRMVVDAIKEALPTAVVMLRPFTRYAASGAVNREIRHLADGKRVVWCGGEEAAAPDQGPCTCRPQARTAISGTRGKWWWLNRLGEKQDEIAAGTGEYDVVMLGDSITHFWEDFTYWSCGRDVFDGMRGRYRLLNLGYGGDHVENLLWRCGNGELDGYKAGIVQIMIGTNNGRDNPADTALGVKKVIDEVVKRQPGAKILLLPIFPRGKVGDARRARNAEVNEIIKGYADGKRVVWFDFTDRFLGPDGEFRPGLMLEDLLHPGHGGYELWRDAVMPKYAELLGR